MDFVDSGARLVPDNSCLHLAEIGPNVAVVVRLWFQPLPELVSSNLADSWADWAGMARSLVELG